MKWWQVWALLGVNGCCPAVGGERGDTVIDWDSFGTVYQGSEGEFFQAIAATGMIQYQVAGVRSNYDSIRESEFRRFRFGGKIEFADHFLFSGSANFDPEEADPFYDSLSTVYIAWSPHGNDEKSLRKFHVAAGKLKPQFTREYSTSAKRIRTFERSLLVNQLAPAKATGIWVEGERERWSYVVSVFSGDDEDEFSRFENGALFLGKLGYEMPNEVSVGLDLIVAGEDQEITEPIDYALSLSTEWNLDYESGPVSLVTDLIFADGRNSADGDQWGLVLLGGYQLTEQLELVARYHLASSSADDRLRSQRQYEREAAPRAAQLGDFYQSGWLGLNYYLIEHQLKLMGGIEYSSLKGAGPGFDGWSWFTGVRMYF